jgi:hypothetical protein
MTTKDAPVTGFRETILAETRLFLDAIESGASDEILGAIMQRIRETERQLLQAEGKMLDPEVWAILQRRMENRQPDKVIDIAGQRETDMA